MGGQREAEQLMVGQTTKHLLERIRRAKSLDEVSRCLLASAPVLKFEIYHIGICRLDEVPIKESLFSTKIGASGLAASEFPDEWKWAICSEGEAMQRPFNLLSHAFTTVDDTMFSGMREMGKLMDLKQVMIIPVRIRNTMTIAIANFPNADYSDKAERVLSETYQLLDAIFERFPTLTKWPDECRLSAREKEILEFSASGMTEAVISLKLGISTHTVRNHVQSCKRKLDARTKLHAVAIAISEREIAPDLSAPEGTDQHPIME